MRTDIFVSTDRGRSCSPSARTLAHFWPSGGSTTLSYTRCLNTQGQLPKERLLLYRHECFTGNYYIDTSVLLENIPCVKSIPNYIRDPSGVVGIISRFSPVVWAISRKTLVSNIIKRKLHGGLKIWILFSRGKNNILLIREALVRKILFLPLENKIHIFAPPCNILYFWSLKFYKLLTIFFLWSQSAWWEYFMLPTTSSF